MHRVIKKHLRARQWIVGVWFNGIAYIVGKQKSMLSVAWHSSHTEIYPSIHPSLSLSSLPLRAHFRCYWAIMQKPKIVKLHFIYFMPNNNQFVYIYLTSQWVMEFPNKQPKWKLSWTQLVTKYSFTHLVIIIITSSSSSSFPFYRLRLRSFIFQFILRNNNWITKMFSIFVSVLY